MAKEVAVPNCSVANGAGGGRARASGPV